LRLCFFQAEDGIRVLTVTGVQTCALPIWSDAYPARLRALARTIRPGLPEGVYAQFAGPQYETPAEVRMAGLLGADLVGMSTALRSEERRVGKEWRSPWPPRPSTNKCSRAT